MYDMVTKPNIGKYRIRIKTKKKQKSCPWRREKQCKRKKEHERKEKKNRARVEKIIIIIMCGYVVYVCYYYSIFHAYNVVVFVYIVCDLLCNVGCVICQAVPLSISIQWPPHTYEVMCSILYEYRCASVMSVFALLDSVAVSLSSSSLSLSVVRHHGIISLTGHNTLYYICLTMYNNHETYKNHLKCLFRTTSCHVFVFFLCNCVHTCVNCTIICIRLIIISCHCRFTQINQLYTN